MKRFPARKTFFLHAAIGAALSGLIFTGLSAYYVRTVGMNPLQLVLVGTAVELTAFLFEVPTGVVADRYSRRLSVLIGGFLVGACYVLTGLAPLFLAIIVAEMIRGVGEAFMSGAFEAWITDEVGADQAGAVFMRGSQVGQIGFLVGVGGCVLLASLYDYNIPILLGGFGMLALYGLFVFVMPETGFIRPPVAARQGSYVREHARSAVNTFRAGARTVRLTPVLLLLVIAELIRGAASEGYDRLWEAQFLTNLNMPALSLPVIGPLDPIAWFGLFELISAVLGVTVMEVVRRRYAVDARTPNSTVARRLMVLYGIATVATIAIGLSGNFALAVAALMLRNVAWGTCGPIAGAWMNLHIPSAVRATVLSMCSQANAFGQIAGGPVVGAVGRAYGIRAAIVLSGVLLAPVVALYGRAVRREGGAPRAEGIEVAQAEAV